MAPGPWTWARRRRKVFGYWCLLAPICVLLLGLLLWPERSMIVRAGYLAVVWSPAVIWRTPGVLVPALEASGPVFVKLAQWLSTRRDILPEDLCDGMSTLHERVRCKPRRGDRRKAEALVEGLQVGPLLGGGCIAQVYSGRLERHGTWGPETLEVAVKVRRENVVRLMETDLKLLRWAARAVEWFRPDLKWLSMDEALDNFGWYLVQQLDLRIEAEHLGHFAENFQSGRVRSGRITVPRVIAATEAVMVMELAKGVSLSQFVKQKHSKRVKDLVFTSLLDTMARMVLLHKFIHGDLHPGNIFISLSPPPLAPSASGRGLLAWRQWRRRRAEERLPMITLIDAGIAIKMTSQLSDFAQNGIAAAYRKQPEALGSAVLQLHQSEGLCTHGRDLETLEWKVGHLLMAGALMCKKEIWGEVFETYEEYRGSRVSEYFTRMIALLSEHRVRVSPALWSLMTAFALIEGSVSELGYGVNVLRAAMPYILRPSNVAGKVSGLMRLALSERDNREGKDR